MPAIAFDIIVLLGIVYCGFLGLSRGFFTAAVAGAEVLGALILAVLLHEPLAGLLGPLFMDSFGFFMPSDFAVQPWAVFLCFSLVFWLTLGLVWKFANPKFIDTEVLPLPLIDQLGGVLAGAFAGSLFLGAILVNWSMCPLLKAVPVPAGEMWIDVGSMALRTAGRFAGERLSTGWSVPTDGEPPPTDGIEGPVRLSSEAWRDRNASGEWDFEDPYRDSDGNGSWTKDYKYVDLDGDRRRRVGLVEKYVVGCWDAGIRVNDREPGAGGGPPKAPPPKPGPQPQQPPPTPTPPPATGQKPPETPPVKPPVKNGAEEPAEEPVEELF
jgi:uncharacterized membrane protein required for colicin V production